MTMLLTILAIILAFMASIYAYKSQKDLGLEVSFGSFVLPFVAVNGIMTLVAWGVLNHPWTFIVILGFLTAIVVLNREGRLRCVSWSYLLLHYCICLAFSIARLADKNGMKKGYLYWYLAIPIVFVILFIKSREFPKANTLFSKIKNLRRTALTNVVSSAISGKSS